MYMIFAGDALRSTLARNVIGFLGCALLLLAQEGNAQPQSSAEDPSPHSEAVLVSEQASIQPGEPFTVALRIEMEDGWHSYWKNPGDSGEPTSIAWDLPDGFSADSLQWPYPHRIEAGPFVSYGYSDEVFHPITINPPETLESGTTVRLEAHANWLICEDICLPAEQDVQLSLPVRAAEPELTDRHDDLEEVLSRLPQRAEGWEINAFRSSGSYALRITPPAEWSGTFESPYFFSAKKAVIDYAAPQPVSRDGDTYVLALQQSEYAQNPAERLKGVLVPETDQNRDDQVQAVRIDVSVTEDRAAAGISPADSQSSMTFIWALMFAFAGGVILNVMPCVFPVLSVKMLSMTEQAAGKQASFRAHGLVFGLGVLVAMWLLAGALLILRAAGSEIGWGFQLQSPTFVALMVLLFFAIGLSLLGVFEVGNRLMSWGSRIQGATESSGYTESFLTGVLTTVVATPCTAPFMGAALGYAITLSAVDALLIFSVLGAGIAAPYVALSMAPRLLQRLPDPGPWMETLKQILAFPMFATAIWLVWVFGQQVGTSGITFLLLGILLLSLAAWIVNRWSIAQISRQTRIVTRGLAGTIAVGAVFCALLGATSKPAATGTSETVNAADDSTWQEYSPERVEQLRSEGRPVFVDFTAAWCLTCQVNERTVLNTAPVQEAFNEGNVVLIKADWTNRNKEITRALESHGRSGVPLYVLYKGDGSEPVLLPEVLTQGIVIDALSQLPDADSAPSQVQRSTTETVSNDRSS